MKLPEVVGLVLCDRMEVDPQARQMSLVGIAHSLFFRNFPSPPRSFTVYGALYDGTGEGTIELSVHRLETEKRIYRYQRWFALAGRGQPMHLEIPVRRCVFPAPGRYILALSFDAKRLTHRLIDVVRSKV